MATWLLQCKLLKCSAFWSLTVLLLSPCYWVTWTQYQVQWKALSDMEWIGIGLISRFGYQAEKFMHSWWWWWCLCTVLKKWSWNLRLGSKVTAARVQVNESPLPNVQARQIVTISRMVVVSTNFSENNPLLSGCQCRLVERYIVLSETHNFWLFKRIYIFWMIFNEVFSRKPHLVA